MENFTNDSVEIASLPKYEEVDFQLISMKYLTKSLIQTTAFMAVVLLVFAGSAYYFEFNSSYLIVLALLGIFLWFGFLYWNTVQLQKNYGFALREKDILYRRGFLNTKITMVPFNRIQHVSTTRGLLDKKLGIATLNIFTAGGSGSDIKIPGLTPELALQLKESVGKKLSADA